MRIGAGSATVAVLDEKIFKKIGIQSTPRRFILVLIMMAILDHFRVFIHFDPCLCPSDSSGTLTAQKHVAYTVLAPRQATAWTPGIRVRDALAWQVGHCLLVWWTSLIPAVSLDGRGQTCLCVKGFFLVYLVQVQIELTLRELSHV